MLGMELTGDVVLTALGERRLHGAEFVHELACVATFQARSMSECVSRMFTVVLFFATSALSGGLALSPTGGTL